MTPWTSQLAAARGPAPEHVGWCPKPLPTFSDALALTRRETWTAQAFAASTGDRHMRKVPADLPDRLLQVACRPP